MKNTHYYIYDGRKFDNMKELCQGIPNLKSKNLKFLLHLGIVKKVVLK